RVYFRIIVERPVRQKRPAKIGASAGMARTRGAAVCKESCSGRLVKHRARASDRCADPRARPTRLRPPGLRTRGVLLDHVGRLGAGPLDVRDARAGALTTTREPRPSLPLRAISARSARAIVRRLCPPSFLRAPFVQGNFVNVVVAGMPRPKPGEKDNVVEVTA